MEPVYHIPIAYAMVNRCREMIKGGARGISLHVGSGNSILPVVDALLGFTVIVSDSYLPNMKIVEDIIKSNKNISDRIEGAGGKINYFEALDIKGKDSSKIRLTDFGENSIDHITITNVFNNPGSNFDLYQVVEVIKDIFSILKKGGTITTDKNAAIGGIEMTFLKQHPEYTTDKVLLGQGTVGNNFYLFHLKDKKVVSSSITKASKPSLRIDDNKGGIAFNALPIQTESVASSALGALSGGRAFNGDLDAEWGKIQSVFNAGIRPSIQRLSEYTAAAAVSPLAEDKIDQVRVMLADILRRDEESQKPAPAEETCKQLLRALEAG